MRNIKIYLFTIILWLVCVSIYAWVYVTNMMNHLKINPSPDLYANNSGFQFIAFLLTRGFPAFVILVAILFVEIIILKKQKNNSEVE